MTHRRSTDPGPSAAGAGASGALVLLVVAATLLVATARELAVGRADALAAESASNASDWPNAISHARAAAEAYAPGSPWPERGLRRLATIGHGAETRGDDAVALLAYGAMREAALETYGPFATSSRWREAGEEGLGRVAAAHEDAAHAAAAAQAMLDALRHDPGGGAAGAAGGPAIAALALSAAAMLAGLATLAFGHHPRGSAQVNVAKAVAAGGFFVYAATLLAN